MKPETQLHLKNLKDPEYARKHRQKMIKRTLKDLFYCEDNPNASGKDIRLHKRNIETIKHNLIVELNTKPEEITWY